MYNNNTDKDLLGAGLTAGLGAGIVTSFAVSQGQNPMIALAITAIAAMVGVLCRLYDLA
jgi:FtsH-binding integral membrane protein